MQHKKWNKFRRFWVKDPRHSGNVFSQKNVYLSYRSTRRSGYRSCATYCNGRSGSVQRGNRKGSIVGRHVVDSPKLFFIYIFLSFHELSSPSGSVSFLLIVVPQLRGGLDEIILCKKNVKKYEHKSWIQRFEQTEPSRLLSCQVPGKKMACSECLFRVVRPLHWGRPNSKETINSNIF